MSLSQCTKSTRRVRRLSNRRCAVVSSTVFISFLFSGRVPITADFIAMNRSEELWVWFCGLRCFLSSRLLHIYRLYFICTKRFRCYSSTFCVEDGPFLPHPHSLLHEAMIFVFLHSNVFAIFSASLFSTFLRFCSFIMHYRILISLRIRLVILFYRPKCIHSTCSLWFLSRSTSVR